MVFPEGMDSRGGVNFVGQFVGALVSFTSEKESIYILESQCSGSVHFS